MDGQQGTSCLNNNVLVDTNSSETDANETDTAATVLSPSATPPYPWSATDMDELRTAAQQVAIVLSQLQLQHQLNQERRYQAVVNQLTMAIRNSSDLGEILKLAVDGLADVLQLQRATLLRLKYSDPLFKQRASNQLPSVKVTPAYEWTATSHPSVPAHEPSAAPGSLLSSFWLADCALCQKALLDSTEPLALPDTHQFSAANPELSVAPIFDWDAPASLLLAPLESQGTVLGFLALQHDRPHIWQAAEITLVELVCAQLSTAIVRTDTLRQVQALVEKRTAELRQSLSVQAKLYERTRLQIDQLRHLNQLKDEFLSTISHELRTPLTSMTIAIRMLRQTGLSGDRSDRYLDILEQQCTQETNLINDLLALQELESQQVSVQPQELDLNALVQELAIPFSQRWAAKGLSLQIEQPPLPLRLQSDRDSLNRVLLELLTNAGKYSDPNSVAKLSLLERQGQAGNEIVLMLSNTGAGIAADEMPHIFDKFRRAQGATQNAIQGTGLGLALVKGLVQLLNGTIRVSSVAIAGTPSYETCFTVILPQFLDSTRL